MPDRKFKIGSEHDYNALMKNIDALMKKGEKNLSHKEVSTLREMALAAQAWEKDIYTIPAPKTLEGIIELKMFERRLKQKELAKLLNMGEPKLSQILNGKRDPDVAFLKALHRKLDIDGNLLLKYA